jgi:histidinol dehydrogenase
LLQRPAIDNSSLQQTVRAVMDEVKKNGDAAIKQFTEKFDGVVLEILLLLKKRLNESATLLSAELKQAIEQAAANITLFHKKQVGEVEIVETMPGVKCWRKVSALKKWDYIFLVERLLCFQPY